VIDDRGDDSGGNGNGPGVETDRGSGPGGPGGHEGRIIEVYLCHRHASRGWIFKEHFPRLSVVFEAIRYRWATKRVTADEEIVHVKNKRKMDTH
jgi:hypothetical protein